MSSVVATRCSPGKLVLVAQPILVGRTQKDSPKKPPLFFVEKVIPRDRIAHSFRLLKTNKEVVSSYRQLYQLVPESGRGSEKTWLGQRQLEGSAQLKRYSLSPLPTDDLGQALGEFFRRADQNVHAHLAKLARGRLVVRGPAVAVAAGAGAVADASRGATFQALRLLVNRELSNLQELLRILPECLRPGGRVAIISFHSGEDRLVKVAFREGVRAALIGRPPTIHCGRPSRSVPPTRGTVRPIALGQASLMHRAANGKIETLLSGPRTLNPTTRKKVKKSITFT